MSSKPAQCNITTNIGLCTHNKQRKELECTVNVYVLRLMKTVVGFSNLKRTSQMTE